MHQDLGKPSLPRRVARFVGRLVVTVAVVVYTILDQLLFPLLRPLLRWLSGLRFFESLGAAIGRLPPYVVLILLAVPFAIIEPLKVFALYWGATGHVVQGGVLLVAAHLLSILTCDRIYHAGREPLLRIGWFRRLMEWLVFLRDRAIGWARETGVWQWSAATIRAVRGWLAGVLASLR